MAWIGAMLKSGASWRHLLYAVLHFPWAVFAFSVALNFWAYGWAHADVSAVVLGLPGVRSDRPGFSCTATRRTGIYLDNPFEITLTALVGLLLTLATPWIVRALTLVDRLLVRGLLGPSRLATRVVELESDRGVVVDTAAADLRRIERDLHDGAQARLVALAMDLGLAKEKLTEDPQAAARMVDEAHGEVKIGAPGAAGPGPRHPSRRPHRPGAGRGPVRGRLALHRAGAGRGGPAGPAGAGDRGHRVLHRLRAAAERQQARAGDAGVRRRLARPATG